MMAQIALAAWLAMATVATRSGLRASSAVIRGSATSGRRTLRATSEVMPMISNLRRYWSPILEIRPSRAFPPLQYGRRSGRAMQGGVLAALGLAADVRNGGTGLDCGLLLERADAASGH